MSSLLIVACWSEQAVRVPGCGSVQLVAKARPACFLCPAKWTLEQADISVLPPLESYNTVVNWLLRDASPILSLRKLPAVGLGRGKTMSVRVVSSHYLLRLTGSHWVFVSRCAASSVDHIGPVGYVCMGLLGTNRWQDYACDPNLGQH